MLRDLALVLIIHVLLVPTVGAQINPDNPLGKDTFLKLDGVAGYYLASGTAVLSYLVNRGKNDYAGSFSYQGGYFKTYRGPSSQVIMNNLGVELQVKPWFLVSFHMSGQKYFGSEETTGFGIKTGYRWYMVPAWRIRPFFEYGAGFMVHKERFPSGGTFLIFTPTYQFGMEARVGDTGRLRIGWGHLHMSTADLFMPNIGFDSNGITLALSRKFR